MTINKMFRLLITFQIEFPIELIEMIEMFEFHHTNVYSV